MSEQLLVIVFATAAVFSGLFALVLQRRCCRRLRLQVGRLEEQLQREPDPPERFSQNLAQAERCHKIPRPHQPQEMPDRYRYISAMARQGMSAAQIATALHIGEDEAVQIVRLAQLKRVSN